MLLNKNIYNVLRLRLILLACVLFGAGLKITVAADTLFIEWEFFKLNGTEITMSLLLDWMSLIFLATVSLISRGILKYCIYYIESDKIFLRFTYILIAFIISMWFLIIRPNMIRILLGWDGLGLTSYLLVIFYQNRSSYRAGIITVLRNRIGDVSILLAIALLRAQNGWNFIFYDTVRPLVTTFIVLAAITKRAQIPFSAWLPAAIAAPTPVSALVHSSTLVTAGVYLLIRFRPLIDSSCIVEGLLCTGVLTIFMSGLGANFETDIKKIVALSTLRQLGLMVIILSFNIPELAFFHLIVHALFKSTLFIRAGFIIHRIKGSQDSRHSRGFLVSRPVLGVILGVTNRALCGFPFLSGFFSKDILLERFIRGLLNWPLLVLVVVSTGLTVSYRVRLIYKSVSRSSALTRVSSLHDTSINVIKRTIVLGAFSLTGGFWIYWGLFYTSPALLLLSLEKYLILRVITFRGVRIFLIVRIDRPVNKLNLKLKFKRFFSIMWFLPKLSTIFQIKSTFFTGVLVLKNFETGWLEYYGPQGGARITTRIRSILQQAQTTIIVRRYLFFSSLLIILFLSY